MAPGGVCRGNDGGGMTPQSRSAYPIDVVPGSMPRMIIVVVILNIVKNLVYVMNNEILHYIQNGGIRIR